MTFDEQKNVVDELMVDLVPATATIVPYRQTISARRAMTEKEKFLASANQASLIPPAGGIQSVYQINGRKFF